MIGDAGEDVGEPGSRSDSVELARLDQRIDGCRPRPAGIGARRACMEQSKRDRSPILRMERPVICWSAEVPPGHYYFVVEVDPEHERCVPPVPVTGYSSATA